MSSGNLHAEQSLTPEARKHLLLVACTIDRLHLLNTWQRPAHGPEHWLAQLGSPPWLEVVLQTATRLLPRRLRFLLSLLRTWGQVRRR